MCAGGEGSKPGTDKLDLGFHPFGVAKISSSVTATEDCGVKACGREMATCGLCSQRRTLPHVVSLRLARGALEVLECIKGALAMVVYNF